MRTLVLVTNPKRIKSLKEFLRQQSVASKYRIVPVFDHWPGPSISKKSDCWPAGEARCRVTTIMSRLQPSRVVFVGRDVARAFLPSWCRDTIPFYQWFPSIGMNNKLWFAISGQQRRNVTDRYRFFWTDVEV